MRIVFCDDDAAALEQLQKQVRAFFDALPGKGPTYTACTDSAVLLQQKPCVDIAFLDVEMPGVDGLQLGAALKEVNPNVKIFIVTSYPDYLDEAMRNQVYRFLSKPVDTARLHRNLRDAVRQYAQDTREVLLQTSQGVVCLRAHQVIYMEATGRKTTLHTTQGNYLSVDSFQRWCQMLALPYFYSPYRGVLINMRYVTSFDRDQVRLRHGDQEHTVYLARRKYMEFKETFLLYQEGVR